MVTREQIIKGYEDAGNTVMALDLQLHANDARNIALVLDSNTMDFEPVSWLLIVAVSNGNNGIDRNIAVHLIDSSDHSHTEEPYAEWTSINVGHLAQAIVDGNLLLEGGYTRFETKEDAAV